MGNPDGDDATLRGGVAQDVVSGVQFALTVVEGPDRGARLTFDSSSPSPLLVGQSPTCALRLSDRTVSRRHFALDLESDGLHLRDLGSTNGTLVDGVRAIECFLRPGQTLRVGDTTLHLEPASPVAVDVPEASSFGGYVGSSFEMRRLYPLCERLAQTSVPLVIEGETGTGKEVMAEAIHERGPRSAGPYVVFDCTAVPPTLVEAELFGYEKGAFTGALTSKRGLFEEADKGTLLIDEIGDLDLALQPKLLRAVERSEVRRIGGSKLIKVDVRVIAATRRDLDREVQAGRFRDDLFHRLAVARIELPPLRRRRSDIVTLTRHFWAELGGDPRALTDAMLLRTKSYDWPGNIRELRNAVARNLALGDLAEWAPAPGAPAEGADDFIGDLVRTRVPLPIGKRRVVDEFERRYIEELLAEHGGNATNAAKASGIAPRYFRFLRRRQGQ